MFLEKYKFKGTWRKYQEEVLKEFNIHAKDKKINVVAAPGSGKTILGLEIVHRLNEHVLILAPTITIRNQWKERFLDMFVPEGLDVNFFSDDIYNLNKFNIVTYQALHYAVNKKKIEEEQNELEEEEQKKRVKAEHIEYDLINALKEKRIKTIVLDEAHHLRAEWWKSLCTVINSLEEIKVVSLTATPPYDVDENEWKRYEEVCGTIDAEISVPELVATGDLCPHQDYVIFNTVTPAELSEIRRIRKSVDNFIDELKKNQDFIEMIRSNKVISSWQGKEELILSNAGYYGSILIFLNSIGVKIDKRLANLLSGSSIIPSFNKKWAEILLKNVIYVDKDAYKDYEQLITDLKKKLEILGCTEKRNVYLNDIKAISNLMASSAGKMDSIERIVEKEYASLKENLSMVVLADYVRYDFIDCNIENINKIGVVPIFRRLLSKKICKNIAVLTGKLKIVPKSVVAYIQEQLQLMGLNDNDIFSDYCIDNNYVVIKGSKKIENAVVNIVTECINLKKINVVIGTVALLGEGWDAPAVNSLILASYVGSFMLSNQMRGRAIRKSKDQDKTANIWHLASLAKLNNNITDLSDFETLQRRFKGFVGIDYKEDVIQDGIERLSIIDISALQKNHLEINEEMYKLAENRALMAKRWKKIIDMFGGTNIKMVDKLNGDFKVNSKIFVTKDLTKMLVVMLITNIIFFIVQAGIGLNPFNTMVYIIEIIYYLIKIIRHLNPISYMKGIGESVLNSMVKTNKLVTNKQLVSSVIEKYIIDGVKYYKTYLKGATVYENNLFIQGVKDVYSKIVDTRYIICVQKKNNIHKDSYFNVPSIFDTDKNEASIFYNEWKKHVCKGTLIYTRSKEGRKLLLKARKNSMSYKEDFFTRKEASKWE